MIIIRRSDGACLNISACCTMAPHTTGLIVEMPNNEMFLVSNFSVDELVDWTSGRWNTLYVFNKEFRGWPE